MSSETKSNFLAVFLRSRGTKNLGIKNPAMQALADDVGLSVHTIQSMALGRRTLRDKEGLRKAIQRARA